MRKSFAAVLEGPFTKTLTAGIGKPDIMLLRRPIDANKPALCFLHVIVPAVISSLRDICRSLYGAFDVKHQLSLHTAFLIMQTNRGELAIGRSMIAPQPCIR